MIECMFAHYRNGKKGKKSILVCIHICIKVECEKGNGLYTTGQKEVELLLFFMFNKKYLILTKVAFVWSKIK